MSDQTFLAKRLEKLRLEEREIEREMVYPDDYFSTDYFESSILIDYFESNEKDGKIR